MSILIFIIFLAFLILAHEFGHFLAAKKSGVKVEEFGLGYPPRLFGIYQDKKKKKIIFGSKKTKTDSTIYSVNLLPFGGFVKIFGLEEKERVKEKGSFFSVSLFKRGLILLSGVLANLFLAWLAISFAYFLGKPTVILPDKTNPSIKDVSVRIIQILPSSPAKEVDLRIGDVILNAKTVEEKEWHKIKKSQELIDFISQNKGKKIVLQIKRKGKVVEKEVFARKNFPENQGPLGIALGNIGIEKLPFFLCFWQAAKDIFYFTILIGTALFNLLKILFLKGKIIEGVVGPIGIVALGSQFAKVSFAYLLSFVGLLSLNLAILNLLPFPALDGGRILFLFIEKIRKKPISLRVENIVNSIGFALLILLLVIITLRDIRVFF